MRTPSKLAATKHGGPKESASMLTRGEDVLNRQVREVQELLGDQALDELDGDVGLCHELPR